MSGSTARHKLVKSILFDMAKKLGIDTCYRCDNQITDEKDFSIEHKNPWYKSIDPVRLYFSLNNITFSHISCNTKARKYFVPHNKGNITHGLSGYRLGCRCEVCKQIVSNYRKEKYKRLGT